MAEALLQRVARNEPSAFQAVIDQFGGLVWSLARRFSFDASSAEDAVQEVFLEVWKSAHRYDPSVASEATFISMIARRRLIDRARKSGRRAETQALTDATPQAAPSSEPRSETNEDAARAAEALATLSPEQQRVLRLSLVQGLSHDEIARATGLPLGTVKTHCRRGLIRIRELLESTSIPVSHTTGRPS
ncbi:MAG: RNA polymerase sigma factor [Phycisphaerae bacterium]|nr:RNA polymerase sigma factor [Phycisphaerae bacterium]